MKKILLLVSFILMVISSILFVKALQSHTLVQIEDANGNNLNTILGGKMTKLGSIINCTDGYLSGLDSNNNPICEVPSYYFVPFIIFRRTGGTGNMAGYDGMKLKCVGNNEHVCGGVEITRREQLFNDVGTMIGTTGDYSWVNTGIHHEDGSRAYYDCKGWTTASSNHWNTLWEDNNDNWLWTPRNGCNWNFAVLCCS